MKRVPGETLTEQSEGGSAGALIPNHGLNYLRGGSQKFYLSTRDAKKLRKDTRKGNDLVGPEQAKRKVWAFSSQAIKGRPLKKSVNVWIGMGKSSQQIRGNPKKRNPPGSAPAIQWLHRKT